MSGNKQDVCYTPGSAIPAAKYASLYENKAHKPNPYHFHKYFQTNKNHIRRNPL